MSAAVARGKFGSAVRTVRRPTTEVIKTSIKEAE